MSSCEMTRIRSMERTIPRMQSGARISTLSKVSVENFVAVLRFLASSLSGDARGEYSLGTAR